MFDCMGDRFAAIANLDHVVACASDNLAANSGGVLATWIIVGDDHPVGPFRSRGILLL